MQQVLTCCGAANRLGFALNLLLLRLLRCPFSESSQVPARVVQFVGMQLDVHPEALAEYGVRRPQTRDEHFVQMRGHLKLRPYAHAQDHARLTVYLLTRALQRDAILSVMPHAMLADVFIEREAHAAPDAILHHETELPIHEMMVDTAGFTKLMYALYDAQPA